MRRLYVQRHGKSAYPTEVASDHDRPIAKRGTEEAYRTGRLLSQRKVSAPDLVLCSSAKRTMETLVHWQRGFGALPKSTSIRYEKELYLASAESLLERIQNIDATVTSAMIVGHNDGLEQLVRALISQEDQTENAQKARTQEFVTSAFAMFEFPVDSWKKVAAGSGKLAVLLYPKEHPQSKL